MIWIQYQSFPTIINTINFIVFHDMGRTRETKSESALRFRFRMEIPPRRHKSFPKPIRWPVMRQAKQLKTMEYDTTCWRGNVTFRSYSGFLGRSLDDSSGEVPAHEANVTVPVNGMQSIAVGICQLDAQQSKGLTA